MKHKHLGMTHEEHLELSHSLSSVVSAIQQAQVIVGTKLGVSSPAYKKLCRTLGVYDQARSALDDAYHAVTTSEQFTKQGHVYYGGRNGQ
jgi:hypothetical protein